MIIINAKRIQIKLDIINNYYSKLSIDIFQ